MQFATQREHEIGNQIKQTAEGQNRRVHLFQSKAIAEAAMEELGGPAVEVDFSMEKYITRRHQILGLATVSRKEGRWVSLYEGGQTVGVLLHELAHQMEDGAGHGFKWQANFRKVVGWWNENGHRFPYSYGMPKVAASSQFALQY